MTSSNVVDALLEDSRRTLEKAHADADKLLESTKLLRERVRSLHDDVCGPERPNLKLIRGGVDDAS